MCVSTYHVLRVCVGIDMGLLSIVAVAMLCEVRYLEMILWGVGGAGVGKSQGEGLLLFQLMLTFSGGNALIRAMLKEMP